MIRHHAKGEHSDLTKLLIQAHVRDELLFFTFPEDELSIHDARDAVVNGWFPLEGCQFLRRESLFLQKSENIGLMPRGEITSFRHDAKREAQRNRDV